MLEAGDITDEYLPNTQVISIVSVNCKSDIDAFQSQNNLIPGTYKIFSGSGCTLCLHQLLGTFSDVQWNKFPSRYLACSIYHKIVWISHQNLFGRPRIGIKWQFDKKRWTVNNVILPWVKAVAFDKFRPGRFCLIWYLCLHVLPFCMPFRFFRFFFSISSSQTWQSLLTLPKQLMEKWTWALYVQS